MAISGLLGVKLGVAVEHKMLVPVGPLIVHDIDPAGLYPVEPVTTAVRVVVLPRVGALDALKLMVGTNVEILSVTEFEVPAE